MKLLKRIIIILGVLIGLYLIVALFSPSSYKVERTREIAASPEAVYSQISVFENWVKWSPWQEKDPQIEYSLTGEDGTVGCIQSWTGDPELSGSGELEIIELVPNEKFVYELRMKDWDMSSKGEIALTATEEGTSVRWSDQGGIPFFARPMMIFMDMDKMLGADFERGLERIDSLSVLAQEALEQITYEIQTHSFSTAHYLGLRTEEMNISDLDSAFYASAYGQLADYCAETGLRAIGMPVSFAFEWNEEAQKCVLMPAFPIESTAEVSAPFEIYTIEGCKELTIDYYGPYEGLGKAHAQLEAYIEAKGYNYKAMMEEFITDPSLVENPQDVLTRVHYFLK